MRKLFTFIPVALIVVAGTTACASKKFVRTSVGEVNDKVDSLGRSVEETQERTRKNEGRITEVDQKASAAAASAQQANGAAADAKAAAVDARSAANGVGTKLDTFDKQNRRLVYEVVLSEDQGNFKFGKAELPDEVKAKIDEMVTHLKEDPKNVFIEIEGHTDNVGSPAINEKIGMERAQAVEKYLYRAVHDPAAQDERHQLRRNEAGRAEQDEGRSRPEPPRCHPRARVEQPASALAWIGSERRQVSNRQPAVGSMCRRWLSPRPFPPRLIRPPAARRCAKLSAWRFAKNSTSGCPTAPERSAASAGSSTPNA